MNDKCERCGKELPQGVKPYHVSATPSIYLCYDCAEPWEPRILPNGLVLELQAGDHPALVLAQGENRVKVELANVKTLVAALAEVLASGGVYHA